MENFFDLLDHVNKIASMQLENNPESVIRSMVKQGIGASASNTINKLSESLKTKETNSFTTKQEKATFMGPNFSAEKFNNKNKDIEAILQAGYNARVIDQDLNLSDMLNGNQIEKNKGEMILHVSDKLGIKKDNKMSYSDYDAKYHALMSFMKIAKEKNMKLSPANNLYLYNNVVNLLGHIDADNVAKNGIDNIDDLKQIKHGGLQYYIQDANSLDFAVLENSVNNQKEVLDTVRKQLEMQLFNKADINFNMKNCHDKFVKAVSNMQKESTLIIADMG